LSSSEQVHIKEHLLNEIDVKCKEQITLNEMGYHPGTADSAAEKNLNQFFQDHSASAVDKFF